MRFYFGSTAQMKDLERKIGCIARAREPLLVEGESGSGKQALAEHLHRLSGARGQFVRVICSQKGRGGEEGFGTAQASTLFLKHIHLLPAERQESVLVELEDGNGNPPRLVSSAYEALEQLVSNGAFMPELFYRLSAYRISLPPLRERAQDIPELFTRMMADLQAAYGGKVAPPPPAAIDVLMRYAWPGNLRELQNTVRQYLLARDASELAEEIGRRAAVHGTIPSAESPLALREQVRRAARKLEAEIILRTLERYRWNRRRTAASLQISYRSLLYKMKDCNIRTQAEPAAEARGPR